MPVQEIESLGHCFSSAESKKISDTKNAPRECTMCSDTPFQDKETKDLQSPLEHFMKGLKRPNDSCLLEKGINENATESNGATDSNSVHSVLPDSTEDLQNPLGGFMKDLQQQIDYSLLKKAFNKSADKIEKFVHEHLDEMVLELVSTEKTQKRTFEEDRFSCVIKVRRFAGKIQVLAKTECGWGAYKTIHKVVHLAGPMLENQPGPIYAYAKSKGKESLSKELKEIEAQLQTVSCATCKAALESSAANIRTKLSKMRKSFCREARLSQKLPGDADFIKMWTVSKRKDPSQIKGILMEYCSIDLYDLLSKQKYPLSDQSFTALCELSKRLAHSIAMMHESHGGLCHLDLKIGNILLKNENGKFVPKITDYGLAKNTGSPFKGPRGTLPYMAPEQFDVSVKEISPAMDNWSLGIILLEIFYGKKANVFRSNSNVDYVESYFHESVKYPEFFVLYKALGRKQTEQLTQYPALDDIIKGLLTINPEKRWTARQAADALENLTSIPVSTASTEDR